MPVIDIHEHVIPRRGFIGKKGETLVTPDEMIAIMDRLGIDQAVVLPLASPETFEFVQSNDEAFAACDAHPGRFIRFCNVDPRLANNSLKYDFVPVLEYYKSLGCKGIGEVTPNLWWDDPRVQNLMAACEKVGFPFLFHIALREFECYGLIDQTGLPGLERALRRFPALRFFAHSTWFWAEVGPVDPWAERPGYPKGKVEPGGRVPELFANYPNLYGDLSAGSGYGAVSRDPEWGYAFMDRYQDRLMMGLDICHPSNGEGPLIGFMKEALANGNISRTVYDKIMGGNAVRLLGL